MNFHGSSTFGQEFYDSIAGAEADKPYEDVMKATDFLISKGFVDEKIGPTARPAKTYFVKALPKTRSGKIMRRIKKGMTNIKIHFPTC